MFSIPTWAWICLVAILIILLVLSGARRNLLKDALTVSHALRRISETSSRIKNEGQSAKRDILTMILKRDLGSTDPYDLFIELDYTLGEMSLAQLRGLRAELLAKLENQLKLKVLDPASQDVYGLAHDLLGVERVIRRLPQLSGPPSIYEIFNPSASMEASEARAIALRTLVPS